MNLFGGVIQITGITFLLVCVFIIMALGYMLGRIKIKGVDLGTAGVFIVALIFGCLFYKPLDAEMTAIGCCSSRRSASSRDRTSSAI